jgi:hypothetical protein
VYPSGKFGVSPTAFLLQNFWVSSPTACFQTLLCLKLYSLTFSGALDFEHIEEQAEGIFGGRQVYFQLWLFVYSSTIWNVASL